MKKFALIILLVAIVLGLGIYLSKKDSQPVVTNDFASIPRGNDLLNNMQKAGLQPLTAEGTVVHVHQHLDIVINGKNMAVPGEMGDIDGYVSALHTHDDSGIIHLESPDTKNYTLGQFFDEWGVALNDNCVATYCSNDQNKLVVAVNGQPIQHPRDHILAAHEEIEVWYGPKNQNPDLIKSYNFPEGL